MELKDYQRYSEITRGLKKSELVLKNAKIVNVFTGEIIEGDLAIEDGIIVGILLASIVLPVPGGPINKML